MPTQTETSYANGREQKGSEMMKRDASQSERAHVITKARQRRHANGGGHLKTERKEKKKKIKEENTGSWKGVSRNKRMYTDVGAHLQEDGGG